MTITENIDGLREGAANCVLDCGGVRKGQSLFVVSERGAVEESVVDAIVAAGQGAGAKVSVVWGDAISKQTPDTIPDAVLAAYRDADVLISHYPSLQREALVPHFPSETRVRVPNRARTVAMLASDWARFPYSLQRAIAGRLDELMAPSKDWRITTPAGTDVTGTFGAAGGVVGAAFFVDTDEGRARRNFPGGVHSPRSCQALDGVIVCEYLDNVPMSPADQALAIEIAGSCIRHSDGGTAATRGLIVGSMNRDDGYIDSWHGGVHPRTLVPVSRAQNARQWFSYCHCSPDSLHFHLGRGFETTNIGVFGQTLTVAGQVIYDQGRLVTENDPVMGDAISRAGIDNVMLSNLTLQRW
jgi:hypothetical protein